VDFSALESNPLIQGMAWQQTNRDAIDAIAGGPKGGIRATIRSVDDPEKRGRVKVIFDDMNPEKPQIEGATGPGGFGKKRPGVESQSHWIDCKPSFDGKQPKRLIGLRVSIAASDGQYQYAVLDDVIWDENVLNKKTEQPNTGTMVRLPMYEKDELPLPSEKNRGLSVVQMDGPFGDDWLCVCLKRSGRYIWVRHVDLQHGHAGGNDVTAYADTGGDKPFPGKQATINDQVFPTSAAQMPQYSAYGTKARGNPYNDQTQWFPSPMSKDKPLPTVPPTVNNQDEALQFIRDSDGFAAVIPGSPAPVTVGQVPQPIASILPFTGFNINFDTMLQNIINFLKEEAKKQLSQLTQGLSDQILNASQPPTTPPA